MASLQMVDVLLPTTDGWQLILPRYAQPEKEQLRNSTIGLYVTFSNGAQTNRSLMETKACQSALLSA